MIAVKSVLSDQIDVAIDVGERISCDKSFGEVLFDCKLLESFEDGTLVDDEDVPLKEFMSTFFS